MDTKLEITLQETLTEHSWRTHRFRNATLSFKRDIDKKKRRFVNLVIGRTAPVTIKVTNNVQMVFGQFLKSQGKATVRFKEPKMDCMMTVSVNNEGNKHALSQLIMLIMQICKGKDDVLEIDKIRDDRKLDKAIREISKQLNYGPASSLRNITDLDLAGRQISALPAELGELQLIRLNLSNNTLSEGPDIWPWTRGPIRYTLSELLVNNNGLKRLPPEIQKCGKLKILQLEKNNLKSIPPALMDPAKCLQVLVLDNNEDLRSIPFVKTHQLQSIHVEGCFKRQKFSRRRKNLFESTLFYLAANALVRARINFTGEVPRELERILDLYHCCTRCYLPVLYATNGFVARRVSDLAISCHYSGEYVNCYQVLCDPCIKKM